MKPRNRRGPMAPWGTPERTCCVRSHAVSDHLLFSLIEEGLSPAFDIAPHSIVVQLMKESCVWDFVKHFCEVKQNDIDLLSLGC